VRAVVVREHGPVAAQRVEPLPDPAPGPGEVLVEVHAAGLNFPDILVIEGKYQILPPRPFSPGKELAGIVKAVGDGVTTCRVGDRVMAWVEHGAYAELALVPQVQCFVMPASMGYAEGAAMGVTYITAWFALNDRAQAQAGETVLVTGAAGGLGLACVQVAHAMGCTVIAGITNPARAELVKAGGAAHVVDLAADNLRDSLRKQVAAVTGGRGADVVLDPVGGDVFDAAIRALAWRGRLVVLGFAAGRIPEVKANYLLVKNIAVSGLQVSDYRDRDPAWFRRAQGELLAWYEAGLLKPQVTARYPLEGFAEGLAHFTRRGMHGKIVLAIKEDA
jgi:NADPH2:quinone reductase